MKKHEQESRIAQLEAEVAAARAGLYRLAEYVQSEKFWREPLVNVEDVLARVRETLSDINDVEAEPYGLCTPVTREKAWRDEASRPHVVGITDGGYITFVPRYLEGYDLRREVRA